jgi:hypothetical protein
MFTARNILYGVVLALSVAWISVGSWYSWQRAPRENHELTDAQKRETSQKEQELAIQRDIARFNHQLVIATWVLGVIGFGTGVVLYFTLRATQKAAEHIPRVERAYVSGGAPGIVGSPHSAVTIDNYGKTPAFIGTIWANIVPENELPDTPVYDPPEFGWFGGQMLKPDTSGHLAGVTRLWDVIEGRVIYGRIWYRDIFKQCHSAGFILRILGLGRTIAVENRDAYWEDRPEPDLGPAARTLRARVG